MEVYVREYLQAQKAALEAVSAEQVSRLILEFKKAWDEDRRIFVFGNGGSAANASHFVTDLGKSASDAMKKPFRCLSLNDNTPWITAIGNDYDYKDVFLRQLKNFGNPGDIVFTLSVSGSSPNVVTAVEWAREHGLYTIALVGGKRGKLAELADFVIAIDSTHYGRVEDVQMGICHMICYAFVERGSEVGKSEV
jgi:D-sedoheptulose 7-phosphate isomerase